MGTNFKLWSSRQWIKPCREYNTNILKLKIFCDDLYDALFWYINKAMYTRYCSMSVFFSRILSEINWATYTDQPRKKLLTENTPPKLKIPIPVERGGGGYIREDLSTTSIHSAVNFYLNLTFIISLPFTLTNKWKVLFIMHTYVQYRC